MIRSSGASLQSHSAGGRSLIVRLPVSGSRTLRDRFQTNRPTYRGLFKIPVALEGVGDGLAGANGLRRREREAAREHRQPAKERLLGCREQLMTPVDHPARRLVTGQDREASVREEAETVGEPAGDLLGA